MHKLLARQVRAASRKDGGGIDVDALLAIIDQAYEEFDRERRLNDRAAKLMEDELKAANLQSQRDHDAVLAAILENATDGMLVTTESGIVDTANTAAEVQFGAPQGGLIGRSIRDLVVQDAEKPAEDPIQDSSGAREGTATTLDGDTFAIEFSVSVLEAASGKRRLWAIRNIAERVRAQREILENRLRFQDFAEASSDCFWELNPALTHADVTSAVDPQLARRLAYALQPDENGGVPSIITPEAWIALRRSLTGRRHFRDFRVVISEPGDSIVHVSLSGKPVFDLDGRFRGYRGTGRDITREVAAQEAVSRAERRFVEATNAAPSALALTDSNLVLLACNSALTAAAQAAKISIEPGRSLAPLFVGVLDRMPEQERDPASLLRLLAATGETRELAVGGIWHLLAARSLSDGGMVLILSDITALKQRESELAEAKLAAESANHLKSQFLATMSHELRTPLNAILGFSEVIRDQVFGNRTEAWKKYSEYASTIHTSGNHLLSLISEILDLSKIEAGSYVLDLEAVDLRTILSGAATIISPTARKAGVTLEAVQGDAPMTISADERAMRQIALNLLSNAIKFTPQGGTVSVNSRIENGMVEFSVRDTGIGIAKEHLQTVFETFRQVDSSIRRRHEGTGLGLAITKRLVELHGGTISLESEFGVGTTVSVRLPVTANAQAPLTKVEAA